MSSVRPGRQPSGRSRPSPSGATALLGAGLCLLLAGLLVTVHETRSEPLPSPRYGVAGGPWTFDRRVLLRLGVAPHYDYTPDLRWAARGLPKTGMLRAGEQNDTDLDTLRAIIPTDRPTDWLIFNEPDLEEQDGVSDAYLEALGEERFHYYARRFHEYRSVIKAAHPGSRVIGPNLFNYDDRFRDWLDAFRAAHRDLYGEEPAFDVWGLHIYYLDWERAPMLSLEYAERHVDEFITYVRTVPGAETAPIWVTEFGTLWAWDAPPVCLDPEDCACVETDEDGVCLRRYGLAEGAAVPSAAIVRYVDSAIALFEARGVERWFYFSGRPATDLPYDVPEGCANGAYLLTWTNRLTPLGRYYRARSLGLPLPPPEELARPFPCNE